MAEGAAVARLVLTVPHGQCEERLLTEAGLTIGRKVDNDLILDDPTVSGYHARITPGPSAFVIEDCTSTNGTAVNGRRTNRRRLRDTDIIAIGPYHLIYRDAPTASPPLRSTPKQIGPTSPSTQRGTAQVPGLTPHATMQVLSGDATHHYYELTDSVTVIGAKHDASIRLTGWFAPKIAAVIARRGNAYVLTPVGSNKRLKLNDVRVMGPRQLEDGDRIEIAGLFLRYLCDRGCQAA